MKSWARAGRATVSRLRGEDFSELQLPLRQLRIVRGRIFVLH